MTVPVLALRALGLGDALTGVPALRGLRRLWPDQPLLLATSGPLGRWLSGLGVVDDVVPAGGLEALPRIGRHVAVNLHGRGPQSHRLLLDGRPDELIAFDCVEAGYRSKSYWQTYEHEVDRWCRLVCDIGGNCTADDLRLTSGAPHRSGVVLHPSAASEARRWPPERWTAVARALLADGEDVLLTGSERELCAQIARASGARDSSGGLPLDVLAELVGSARLVLSGDTGVAHLATATRTPSVTLFGPVPPELWGPAIDHHLHAVLYHRGPLGDPHGSEPDPSLLGISVREVLQTAWAQLSGTSQRSA
ncbi:glycosyltransferase family 9 protein [Kribbella jejuensis]|uniref:ADP-heptose:LPS heptosyltransferase n=1 Tax=Kribbella jejuensis TaxID=236068 RepID=A0A542EA41_9ACTN|nr:glycosyltransferase family 9 protein [Kribbella jejuensis]TQJ12183.1 ADP-heptose:LPS heptosyltransferase [Kribbella jejuensis]